VLSFVSSIFDLKRVCVCVCVCVHFSLSLPLPPPLPPTLSLGQCVYVCLSVSISWSVWNPESWPSRCVALWRSTRSTNVTALSPTTPRLPLSDTRARAHTHTHVTALACTPPRLPLFYLCIRFVCMNACTPTHTSPHPPTHTLSQVGLIGGRSGGSSKSSEMTPQENMAEHWFGKTSINHPGAMKAAEV
jgi:hypothetical protein